jgi:hypothetical protein
MAVPGPTITGAGGKPLGFQQISAVTLASATGLTVPTGATCAYVSVDTASVRRRDDGTAPTTSIGMLLTAGSVLTFSGLANLSAVKFILVTGGSPVVNVSFY